MTNTKMFDLVVIGTGSAALTVAYGCLSQNWKVTVIDSRPFGGTCALRGCDPKKVLVGAAEVIDWKNRMQGSGIDGKDTCINWPELMKFKRSFTEPVLNNREEGFAKAGIAAFHGRAHFMSPNSVQVNDDILQGRYVVIATGAKPANLPISGSEHLITSDQFLELDEIPKSVVFVGGGYISMEFAHVAARAGSSVTMLHRGERPLELFDPDLVDMLVQRTRDLGIDLEVKAEVQSIEKSSNSFTVNASINGQKRSFEGDVVVHGAGRVPEIDDLNLEKAVVEYDKRGIKVNEYLQSVSNPSVYAAGDAANSGGFPLTPVAGYEGGIVTSNMLKGNHVKANYKGIPTVVFTIPPLASVGLSEQAAKEKGLRFKVNHADTSGWYSSKRIKESHSGYKVLIEEDTGCILGAHLLGHHAEEVINIFAMAIRLGLTTKDLKEGIFTYPTHTYDINYML